MKTTFRILVMVVTFVLTTSVGALIAGHAVALEPEDCVRLTEPEDCIPAIVEKECGQYPYGNEVRGRCEMRIRDRAINELQTKLSICKRLSKPDKNG
jgi:hypothetical protein